MVLQPGRKVLPLRGSVAALCASWQSLGVLGGIVGIRTVIVYFLNKELQMEKRTPDARL